jgi:hypothetical protein
LKEISNEANIVKDFLYHHGRSKIRDQLEQYIKDLKEGIDIKYYVQYTSIVLLICIVIEKKNMKLE